MDTRERVLAGTAVIRRRPQRPTPAPSIQAAPPSGGFSFSRLLCLVGLHTRPGVVQFRSEDFLTARLVCTRCQRIDAEAEARYLGGEVPTLRLRKH